MWDLKAILVVLPAAASVAACGSAIRSTTTIGAGTAATDQGAARAVTSSGADDATPIDGRAYRKRVASAAAQKGLSPPNAAKVADCIVRKEAAQGYRTVADVARSPSTRQQAVQDAIECTAQALPAG